MAKVKTKPKAIPSKKPASITKQARLLGKLGGRPVGS